MNTKPLAIAGLLLLATLLAAPVASAALHAPAAAEDSGWAAYYACIAAGIDPAICKDLLNRALALCRLLAPPYYDICYHLA